VRFTSLGEQISVDSLVSLLERLRGSTMGVVGLGVGYVVGTLVGLPVTLAITAIMLVFEPLVGVPIGLVGALISAMGGYAVGHKLGKPAIRRLAGERINGISEYLGDHGLITMLTVRVLPVAPFALINVVAGASHVRVRDFTLGTVVGMLPGLVGIGLFIDRLMALIRSPNWATLAVLAAVVLAVLGGLWLLRRWLLARREPQTGSS
jgi:phospholipase D1/2